MMSKYISASAERSVVHSSFVFDSDVIIPATSRSVTRDGKVKQIVELTFVSRSKHNSQFKVSDFSIDNLSLLGNESLTNDVKMSASNFNIVDKL